jgi:hypothetical protein
MFAAPDHLLADLVDAGEASVAVGGLFHSICCRAAVDTMTMGLFKGHHAAAALRPRSSGPGRQGLFSWPAFAPA